MERGPWPWLSLGVGVAAGLTGGWFAYSKSQRDDDIASKVAAADISGGALSRKVSLAERDGTIAAVGFSVAGAAALSALFLYIFPPQPDAEEPEPWQQGDPPAATDDAPSAPRLHVGPTSVGFEVAF